MTEFGGRGLKKRFLKYAILKGPIDSHNLLFTCEFFFFFWGGGGVGRGGGHGEMK